MDKHTIRSEYAGDNEWGHPLWNTTRSEVGEALFQLKYRGDFTQVKVIAAELARIIYPHFGKVGLFIPMPPSNHRDVQPVTAIAKELGHIVRKPVFDQILTKTANGQQLKDLRTKAEKDAALANSFTLHENISNEGCWNALLIDDLFHTGASLEAASTALRKYSKIGKIYVATATWRYGT